MIQVTCAIIEKDGKVLVTQRGKDMKHPLKWEFPGGKIEGGESETDCLIREIREELDISIRIHTALPASEFQYPEFSLRLIPFVCQQTGGEIRLREHAQYRWMEPEELNEPDWTEADIPVVKSYLEWKGKSLR